MSQYKKCRAALRVLHTCPPMGPSYGGPFESIRHTVKALDLAGAKVSVAMPYGSVASAHLAKWRPVYAISHGRVLFRPFEWSPEFAKGVLASDAEVLHTHCIWQHPSLVALPWKRTGRPHVASIKGMLEPWAWQHKRWKKRPIWSLLERRNLMTASLLHATAEQEMESIRWLGIKTPIAVIPHGVTLGGTEKMKAEGLESERRTALFLSRVHPKKGLPMLLEAWVRIRPKCWQLRIVGPDEGGHVAELKQLCGKLGLGWGEEYIEHRTSNVEHRIEEGDSLSSTLVESSYNADILFSGPLTGDAKDAAFREADLFILPTHSENFGMAVAEAMAAGLPVITTQGAPWELLEKEGCGWWVPVSVEGIAGALEDATKRSPEALLAMGKQARQLVSERFSWDRTARSMIACYEWVLGRGPKPDCVFE